MWSYKQNKLLGTVIYPIIHALQFFLELSWLYAHYRNGTFPYQFPEKPRLFFKEWSFWKCVKESWKCRKREY